MPIVGVFSGVNSGSLLSVNDDSISGNYVFGLTEQWVEDEGFSIRLDYTNNSLYRTRAKNGKWGNAKTVVRLKPKTGLDNEAKQIAEDLYQQIQLCSNGNRKNVRAMLFHPKTMKRPPSPPTQCCNLSVQVVWSPFDKVPNQTYSSGTDGFESVKYWKQWGTVVTLDPVGDRKSSYDNHSMEKVWAEKSEVIEQLPRRWFGLRSGEWRGTAQGALFEPKPVLRDWMKDESVDYVFLGHSQGCNILMHVLERVCG